MPDGSLVHYYEQTGFRSSTEEWSNGVQIGVTAFAENGTIKHQIIYGRNDLGETTETRKYYAPWFWNVTNQTKPTAPWWDHEKNRAKE